LSGFVNSNSAPVCWEIAIDSVNLYSEDCCPAIDCNALMKLIKEVLELWSSAIEFGLERFDSLGVDVELHAISEVQNSLEKGCW